MGIKGIYKEIGPGKRVSFCRLAVQSLERSGRPLRLAIDISIWQFQVQAARGGANPAVRTLFYRLVRLLGLPVQPVFVFDGPNKPAFKRNKRSTGRGGASGDAVSNAAAKRLIRLFGFTAHDAPGEAEAECALLQRQGLVDAVLSEDVDTIMFGCTCTLRNWSAEDAGTSSRTSSKPPTHVSVYDTAELSVLPSARGLDREGMVLVALMSGGDYIPEGVPGCGVKVACEAARAGFGRSLCRLKRADAAGLAAWRESLQRELRTNESGFFRVRHRALAALPEGFPNLDVLRYYTHPVVSTAAAVERLRAELEAAELRAVDVPGLRAFVGETFDWTGRTGAVKLIRVLAPSLLVQKMLELRARRDGGLESDDDADRVQEREAAVVRGISNMRSHFSTDATPELRVSFIPAAAVEGLNLDDEPQEIVTASAPASYGRDGLALNSDDEFEHEQAAAAEEEGAPARTKKVFDPLQPDLIWVPATILKLGVPLTVEDWEERQRAKERAKLAPSSSQSRSRSSPRRRGGGAGRKKAAKAAAEGMPAGALDKYMTVTKVAAEVEGNGGTKLRRDDDAPVFRMPGGGGSHVRLPLRTKPSDSVPTSLQPPSSQIAASTAAATTPPRRNARRKQTGEAASKPASRTMTTNPWTLASSSPTAVRIAARPAPSPRPHQQQQQQQRVIHTIDISSSSPARPATPPSPLGRKHVQTPPPENSFDEDPIPGVATLAMEGSPRKLRSSPRNRGAVAASARGEGRREARERHGTRHGAVGGGGQMSIKSFGTVTKGGGGRGRVDSTITATAAGTSTDDRNRCQKGGRPRKGTEKEPSSASSLADILQPFSSSEDEGEDEDNEAGGVGVDTTPAKTATTTTTTTTTTARKPEKSRAKPNPKIKTTLPESKILYVPRTSAVGYFKEVEVLAYDDDDEDDEDGDRTGTGSQKEKQKQEQKEKRRGPAAAWRRSEVSVVDLTGEP